MVELVDSINELDSFSMTLRKNSKNSKQNIKLFRFFSFSFQMHTMETKPDIQNHHSSNGTSSQQQQQQPQQQQSSQQQQNNSSQICAGCGKHIMDRFLLRALDLLWHEDCLKCGCCDCRLGEVGSTLYTKGNLMLCKRDYLRLFGNTGFCAACNKVIPAFEMVMRARSNVYHLECFACQQCNHR